MLVVNQGEVAVIKGFVGLPPPTRLARSSSSVRSCIQATAASGPNRCAPVSTRITRVYAAEIVPTFILTLNWAEATPRLTT
jgi:hypothetical protein